MGSGRRRAARSSPTCGCDLAALPYTLTARAIAGSSDFAADSIGEVLAAAAFCCALAYVAGALVELLLRGAWRLATATCEARRPFSPPAGRRLG